MKSGRFVAIGHIVNDTEPFNHLGGGAAYSAITAAKLGVASCIITKCPASHPYVKKLNSVGVTVFRLQSRKETITSFSNVYDSKGRRKQKVLEQQESITLQDYDSFPKDILENSIILIASVIGEVDMMLFPILSKYGTLAIAPQGYFREIGKDNTVRQKKWHGFENSLKEAQMTFLSEEDLYINYRFDNNLLPKLNLSTPLIILTKGEKGATIFSGNMTLHLTAFHLKNEEIKDLTGAGDVFAAVFIVHYQKNGDLKTAGVVACFYAALKIMGFGGIGIDSIPNKEQIASFVKNNPERIMAFLEANGIEDPNFLQSI